MSQKQGRITWLLIIVLASTLGVLGFASARKAASSTLGAPIAKDPAHTDTRRVDPPSEFTGKLIEQPIGQSSQVRVEQLTLWATGFMPTEITRPSGPIALIVVNNTRVRELSLQLSVENAGRLREVHLPSGKREWRELLDLPPGRYVVTEANHSDWVCLLNITPR